MRITYLLTIVLLQLFAVKAFSATAATGSSMFFLWEKDKCVVFADKCVRDTDNFFYDLNNLSVLDTLPVNDSSVYLKKAAADFFFLEKWHDTLTNLFTRPRLKKKMAMPSFFMNDPLSSIKAAYAGLYDEQRKRLGQALTTSTYFKEVERLKGIVDKDYLMNAIREVNSMTFKKPLQMQGFHFSNTGQYVPLFPDTVRSYFFNDVSFDSKLLVGGVPFAVTYSYQYHQLTNAEGNRRPLLTARFDKNAYVKKIRSLIPDFDPSQFIDKPANIWETVKQQGQLVLQNEIKQISSRYSGLVDTSLQFANIEQVFDKQMQSYVQEYLDPVYLETIKNATATFEHFKQRSAAGEPIDSLLYREAAKVVLRHKASQEILAKIAEHKRKWDESGFGAKLKTEELLNAQKIQQIVKDPKVLLKEAEKYVQLNQFQKLFLQFDHLNIGQSGVETSALTLNNYIGNGINGDFLTKRNNYFSFNAGRQNDQLSLFDRPFTAPLTSNTNNAFGFKAGKGKPGKTYAHLSLNMFEQRNADLLNYIPSSPGRKTAVTTISTGFDLGAYGYLEAELSKSSASYTNIADATDSVQQKVMPMQGLLTMSTLGEGLAFSVGYKGAIEKIDLEQHIQFSSTPMSYSNPGSTLLQRGQTNLVIDLKKRFLDRRLVVTVKGNRKLFSFGGNEQRKWIYSSYLLDIRYKLTKGQSVAIRYQPNQFIQAVNKERVLYTKTERLAADATLGTKLWRRLYRHSFSLAYTNNFVTEQPGTITSVKSLMIQSAQTLQLKKNVLTVSSVYNYVNNQTNYVFFNSSFTCDGSIQYFIFKQISGTSGLGYAATNGWYKQLSYKQGLTGTVNERIAFTFYVDFRKNLKLYQPLYSGTARGEISFSYTIGQ